MWKHADKEATQEVNANLANANGISMEATAVAVFAVLVEIHFFFKVVKSIF